MKRTVESLSMSAPGPLLHDGALGHHHADGHAGAQALRQCHDVRRHIPMLACEHLAGAPDARLNLIEDQENTVAVAEFAQARKKSVGGNEVAPLPLDGPDENGGP